MDFPSVAPAVDRMRRSFLGDERTAPLSATIQLTRHEAREGATVPLEVPVSATCREGLSLSAAGAARRGLSGASAATAAGQSCAIITCT